ncbi:MAG: RCC1 repeat-containing protein, partial [Dehalococcoidia bacterium]|nr:RCC1 repeat-containing protein [Dehalococcoidia bacterium]
MALLSLAALLTVALLWPEGEPAAASGVASVAGGDAHTCARTTTGEVQCWGLNDSGQVGDGSNTQRDAPVSVSGLGGAADAMDTGDYHTCALLAAGGVQCWGDNLNGQLGDGGNADSSTPVDVSGLASGVSDIALGGFHTCAVHGAGVQCWGLNDFGQLGDGSNDNSTSPVDVLGLGTVADLTGGRFHTCALTTTGGVKCWGLNDFGQLGDASNDNRSMPVDVSGLTSGVAAIGAGAFHTCAVTDSGGVKCWGNNENGQLGDGTMTSSNVPVDVCQDYDDIGLVCNQTFAGAVDIGGGLEHSCA